MRGKPDPQAVLFTAAVDLEERVRPNHPLRAIKAMADAGLRAMDAKLGAAYSGEGRPSVPPERLIKAMLLQAIFSVRSEAQLVDRIDTDLLFRWFLDMRIDEPVFDATVFSHNRARLEEHDLVALFFDGTVRRAVAAGLVSPDHFSVDGSLIEAYASIKSFKPKESKDAGKDGDAKGDTNDEANRDTKGDTKDQAKDGAKDGKDDGNGFKSRNAEVDFHGQKRSNETHESATDPDAKLYRKGNGQAATMSHMLHALVENRHGLVLAVEVNSPLGNSEPTAALALVDRVRKKFRMKPRTLGADKGYDQGPFLGELEKRGIRPHVAVKEGVIGGKDPKYRKRHADSIAARRRMRRRTQGVGHKLSQRCRKKIEEWFGWAKCVAGLARTRLRGHWRTGLLAQMAGAAFNLIRMRNLAAA